MSKWKNSGFIPSDTEMNRRLYEAGVGMNLPLGRAPEEGKPYQPCDEEMNAFLMNV